MRAEEAYTELARRYFRWIGPAGAAQFQWFSGLGVKAAKTALDPLKLTPIDDSSGLLILPEDRDAFADFRRPAKAEYALVSGLDGILLLHAAD